MKNQSLQTEIDASYLYDILAKSEKDATIADIYKEMSEIEKGHALHYIHEKKLPTSVLPQPSFRAKMIYRISKFVGNDFILSILLDTEKSLANAIVVQKKKQNIPVQDADTRHVRILENILEKQPNISSSGFSRFESRHRSVGGNALRAAVLGGNDGLISNFSLIMGVAGASNGEKGVLLAGLAGLLAGALSMSLGEWISVKSSQELYENQMSLEMEEVENNPEGEIKELALIYRAKGIPDDQAMQMAREMMQNKTAAHQILIREELGIQPEELEGSAMEAAAYSFFLFAIGAIIPLFPFFFLSGPAAIALSILASAAGLFFIGAIITLFTGKNIFYSGIRQVIFGLAAAAITFGIGKLIGVEIS